MNALARSVLPALLLSFTCSIGRSQSVLYTFDGDSAGAWLGISVSGARDVNGDGVADLIVGASRHNGHGRARILSGVDGSVLYTFDGDSPQDRFGESVSGAGDVNADGYGDLIVGAFRDDNNGGNSGSARVFSGVDGSVLYTFEGNSPGDDFGTSVAGAGDVNADGHDDLIVGAPGDGDSGRARVFSGVDGSILYTFKGSSPGDGFGHSVSGAGDVNADGYDDLIAGAPLGDTAVVNSGSARVFSGLDGSVLYTFRGDSELEWFGVSVSGAGDVNGDGFDDLIVGARFADNNGDASGSAWVISGSDGSVLHRFDGDAPFDNLGASVGGAGDVNGDGLDDLIVGAVGDDNNNFESGSARVFSGADGSTLHTFDGDSAFDRFGTSVSGAGDVDGDGFDDLIVGAYQDDNNGSNSGSARVLSGCDAIGTRYCSPAIDNSSGQPAELRACGSIAAVENQVRLSATRMPVNQFGYFLNSGTQASTFPVPGSQGVLCLGGAIGRYSGHVLSTGPAGAFGIQLDLSHTPTPTGTVAIQAGETWNFTAWFRDLNPMQTSNFTDGVSITFL